MGQKLKFTKSTLAKLAFTPTPRAMLYVDTEVAGLKLKVGMSRKSFFLEKRIKGRKGSAVTFSLGTFPNMTVEDARKKARMYSSLCEQGYDPRKMERTDVSTTSSVLLSDAVDRFFEVKTRLTAVGERGYRSLL